LREDGVTFRPSDEIQYKKHNLVKEYSSIEPKTNKSKLRVEFELESKVQSGQYSSDESDKVYLYLGDTFGFVKVFDLTAVISAHAIK
jgi:hypothetical protein